VLSDIAKDTFVEAFNIVAKDMNRIAREHGFWDNPRNDGEMIALAHSELSECFEALRHNNPRDEHCIQFNNAEVELADCIIRIMDMAYARGYKVAEALLAKSEFNNKRPHMHGKTC
jgi:NTP pyrophosphatase (non-canonical NTP hydrolase)